MADLAPEAEVDAPLQARLCGDRAPERRRQGGRPAAIILPDSDGSGEFP
jgi:hypothetical protein